MYARLQDHAEFRAADRALGQAIDAADLSEARDAVVGPIVQLARAKVAASRGGLVQLGRTMAPDEVDGRTVEELLAEAALGAALALVARDVLPPPTVTVLYAPFEPLIPYEAAAAR